MVFAGNFKQMRVYIKACGRAQEEESFCHRSDPQRTSPRKSASPQMARRWTAIWDRYTGEVHRHRGRWILDVQRANVEYCCLELPHTELDLGSATVGARRFELYTSFELQALSLRSSHIFPPPPPHPPTPPLITCLPLSVCSAGINLPSPARINPRFRSLENDPAVAPR